MARRKEPGVYVRTNSDGSKSYVIRWRQDGRNLSHVFDREREAIDTRQRIMATGSVCHCAKHSPGLAAARPGFLPEEAPLPPAPTFGEYAARHAAALTGVGEGYRRDMMRDVRRHLQGIADRPLDTITELDVRELIRGMETGAHRWLGGRPLSPVTIRRQLAQAGAIMQAAMNDGLATRNPFRGHRLARQVTDRDKGMTFLTHAEWQLLRDALPAGVYRDLAEFLVGTGCRWGEATALAVGAVDLLAEPPRVHVARAWQSDGAGGFTIGPPKSARSRRTLPVVGWVRDLLLPHVAGKADDELVFITERGTPIRASNFHSRVWGPAVKRAQAAGLEKRPRVHDLRHTNVSWLLAEGVPMFEVSRRVGHQSSAITDARYAHLDTTRDAGFSAALEKYRPRA